MQSRDWFGVGVRLFGVWELICAAGYLIAWIRVVVENAAAGSYFSLSEQASSEPRTYILYAGGSVLMASYLLFCTDHLTRLTFRSDSRQCDREYRRRDEGLKQGVLECLVHARKIAHAPSGT